jgi:hypothetical protein
MSSMSAAGRMIKVSALLLAFTLSAQRQNTRPDFTGVWRSVSITLGPLTNSVEEIKQTDFTVALRPVISNEPSIRWSIYSTDGKVMRTKMGRHLIERTGHWEENQLVLEETGPGNAPWRRSTDQTILSLSGDARRMTIKMHNVGDKRSVHDYAIELERVNH